MRLGDPPRLCYTTRDAASCSYRCDVPVKGDDPMCIGKRTPARIIAAVVLVLTLFDSTSAGAMSSAADDPSPPSQAVRLIFVHHSTGGNWLADPNPGQPSGGLAIALRDNHYFVSATNYGWGPDSIGDRTDIVNWPEWFTGPNSAAILRALYNESAQNVGDFGSWSRLSANPGGENQIIVFKSCFPNSDLYGQPSDSPLYEPNDYEYTVANAKAVYQDMLTYFASRTDKLFVLITAPPLMQDEYWPGDQTPAQRSANARALNNWLVSDWLDGYPHTNVAVFDYYNVLTSNGSPARVDDPGTNEEPNDAGREDGNHHRWRNGAVQHVQTVANNYSAYPSGDSHPSTAGHQKATAEFVQLLNVWYHRWQSGATQPTATRAPATVTHTATTAHMATVVASTPTQPAYTATTAASRTAQSVVVAPGRLYLPILVKGWHVVWPTPMTTATQRPSATATSAAPATGLIQPSDFDYLGAFRLPDGPPEIGWEWSGSALTYYPAGDTAGPEDGFPGSLFGTGHEWNQYVAEIGIPAPVDSAAKGLEALNTAETLQEFADIRAGLFPALEMPRVGLEYLPAQGDQDNGKLYFAWAAHLDEGASLASHGWCGLDLGNPGTAGLWRIGDYVNYVTGDYLFVIPSAWADAYVGGKSLATGRYRDGGQGAQGPSLFAIAPWQQGNPPAPGSTLPAIPLLLYGNVYSEGSAQLNGYHHSDEWSGAAWLTAGDRAAVVFVGTKGTGECWYGCSDGTIWPDEPPFPPECPERGWWSSGFVGQMLFYDPSNLAAVAQGRLQASDPQPYATMEIDQHLYHVTTGQQKSHVGAVAFDRQRGLLYVMEPLADGDKSLVHVWRVTG